MTETENLGAIACAYRFEGSDDIRVVWRNGHERHDLWAITRHYACLAEDGLWEVEPMPSNRSDEFLKRCRFPLDEALRRAAKYINESLDESQSHKKEMS